MRSVACKAADGNSVGGLGEGYIFAGLTALVLLALLAACMWLHSGSADDSGRLTLGRGAPRRMREERHRRTPVRSGSGQFDWLP